MVAIDWLLEGCTRRFDEPPVPFALRVSYVESYSGSCCFDCVGHSSIVIPSECMASLEQVFALLMMVKNINDLCPSWV